jgi:superfamily I DNA/RNA helicase
VDYLVRAVRTFHDEGMRWGDIGVLYRDGFMGRKVAERLTNAEIPVNWVGRGEGQSAYRPDVDSVKLVTMHSSKGLEFPLVLIPGVGYMPHAKADAVEEARLFYVAMTRAIDRLIVTCHAESRFAQQLTEAVRRVA